MIDYSPFWKTLEDSKENWYTTMAYFTDEKIEQLLDDPEVVKRLIDFISMDGAAYFEEVRSNLSPEDLEEYLKENPDERIYLKKE